MINPFLSFLIPSTLRRLPTILHPALSEKDDLRLRQLTGFFKHLLRVLNLKTICSLVLFLLAPGIYSQVEIIWEHERAVRLILVTPQKKSTKPPGVFLQESRTPLIGTWSGQNDTFSFQPVVPFSPGLTYEIRTEDRLMDSFQIHSSNAGLTRVLNIYPAIDTVPENLLKMYLTFSRPMGEQLSENFIRVVNSRGDTLPKIFLPLQPELWNEDRTRLTLWLDPGRIKRNLGPNTRLGSPLREGDSYKVIVKDGWKDQRGYPISCTFEKSFTARSADRTKPNPKEWRVSLPKAGSFQPLRIVFNEPMDYALLMESMRIFQHVTVKGEITLEENEKIWSFTPDQEWESGFYKIGISTRLEDLAGNNLNRLFEEEIQGSANLPDQPGTVILDFIIP